MFLYEPCCVRLLFLLLLLVVVVFTVGVKQQTNPVKQTLKQVFLRQAAHTSTSKHAKGLNAALSYFIGKDINTFSCF